MKVSIIIPAYNAEKYINECIDSVVDEIYKHDEIIIIDDGSTDNTENVCRGYKCKNIKIIKQKNSGVSTARNNGIMSARNDYILFLDSDDTLVKGWRNNIERAVVQSNEADIIYIEKTINKQLSKNEILDNIFSIKKDHAYFRCPFSKLFRKTFISESNISFDKNIINGEDLLFNINALSKSKTIHCTNKSIYKYRITEGSASRSCKEGFFESDKLFHKKIASVPLVTNEYSKICLEGALIRIAKRIVNLPRVQRKRYWTIFEQEPYCSYLQTEDRPNIFTQSTKTRTIISLIRHKKYGMIMIIYRVFNLIKHHKRTTQQQIII